MTKSPLLLRQPTLLWALRSQSLPIVWDGGIGTALISRGLTLASEPPEAWLWSHREEVAAVHRGFAAARVDVLQTNSFGLVRLLASDSLPKQPAGGRTPSLIEYVRRSVELAREALNPSVDRPEWVVASIGPTGMVGIDPGKLGAVYGEVASAFASQQVAALHLETCFDATELRVAVRAVREAVPELPLFVSLTVTHGQLGLETPLGVPSVVEVPVFVTVTNWQPTISVSDSVTGIPVTVTATPQLLFEPAEPGSGAKACTGPGRRYEPGGGDLWDQAAASGACTHVYRQRTGADGRPSEWPGVVTVRWSITWSAADGSGGSFPDVDRATAVPRAVEEVQTVVVSGG